MQQMKSNLKKKLFASLTSEATEVNLILEISANELMTQSIIKAQRMYEMVILATGFGNLNFPALFTFWEFQFSALFYILGNLIFPHFLTIRDF